jgi:hypothetical protein
MAPKTATRSASRQASVEATSTDDWGSRLRQSSRATPSARGTPSVRNSPAPSDGAQSRRTVSPAVSRARAGAAAANSYGVNRTITASKITASTTSIGLGSFMDQELGEQDLPYSEVQHDIPGPSQQPRRRLTRLPEQDENDTPQPTPRTPPLPSRSHRLTGTNMKDQEMLEPERRAKADVSRTEREGRNDLSKSFAIAREPGLSDSPSEPRAQLWQHTSIPETPQIPLYMKIWFLLTGPFRYVYNWIDTFLGGILRAEDPQSSPGEGSAHPIVRREGWVLRTLTKLFVAALFVFVLGIGYAGRDGVQSYIEDHTWGIIRSNNYTSNIHTDKGSIATIRHWQSLDRKIAKVDSKVDTLSSTVATIVARTDRTDGKVTGHYSSLELQSLTRHMPVNFFSTTLGAKIDPFLTSPTMDTTRGLKGYLRRSPFYFPDIAPPVRALMPWTEAGECWCAAPSNPPGLAQLAVRTPHLIRADTITVEHIPQTSTLDIKSAPKELEIWAEAEDGHDFNWSHDAGCTSQSIDDPKSYSKKTWVCLGRVKYDIDNESHIQMMPLLNTDIPASRFVVRVVDNYGQKYSCLYRVQLHGKLVNTKLFD